MNSFRIELPWAVVAVVSISTAIRLFFSSHIDLLPEEAYYWNYAQHLDIGYLDHPPLVAWLIRLGCAVFGNTEAGVRIPALGCGIVATYFVYRTSANVFGERSALAAVMLAQVLPFFFMAGFLMTPDAPLTAAWAASVYFLERALCGDRPQAWIAAGLCLGLGLLSKYTILLLGFGCVLFMLWEPAARRWFRCWQPYAAALLALLVFSPVIVWNYEHDWASFVFQTSRRLAEHPQFALPKLLGASLVLLTPTGCIAAAFALARRVEGSPGWRLLHVVTLVPLTVFAVFSLRHEVKLDWMGAPWTAAIPLLAVGFVAGNGNRAIVLPHWLRRAWPPTLLVFLALYAVGFVYLAFGIPGAGYSRHTELIPIAWRDFGRQVENIASSVADAQGDRPLIVGMDRYESASELAFYATDPSRAVHEITSRHLFGGLGLMYERWFPPRLQSGKTLLLVSFDPHELDDRPLAAFAGCLEPVHSDLLLRGGRPVRPFYYRVLRDYRSDNEQRTVPRDFNEAAACAPGFTPCHALRAP